MVPQNGPFLYNISFLFPDSYGIIHSAECDEGRSYLRTAENFNLHRNGTVETRNINYHSTKKSYCLEQVYIHSQDILNSLKIQNGSTNAFVCIPPGPKPSETKSILNTIKNCVLVLSCIFLFLTLVVYIILPDLRNAHGKIVMSHVCTMLIMFIAVSYLRLPHPKLEIGWCKFVGKYLLSFLLDR